MKKHYYIKKQITKDGVERFIPLIVHENDKPNILESILHFIFRITVPKTTTRYICRIGLSWLSDQTIFLTEEAAMKAIEAHKTHELRSLAQEIESEIMYRV